MARLSTYVLKNKKGDLLRINQSDYPKREAELKKDGWKIIGDTQGDDVAPVELGHPSSPAPPPSGGVVANDASAGMSAAAEVVRGGKPVSESGSKEKKE
jgi:hypothetical protein